jgi:hypothetical protein
LASKVWLVRVAGVRDEGLEGDDREGLTLPLRLEEAPELIPMPAGSLERPWAMEEGAPAVRGLAV